MHPTLAYKKNVHHAALQAAGSRAFGSRFLL
jgi:hypothetical protein